MAPEVMRQVVAEWGREEAMHERRTRWHRHTAEFSEDFRVGVVEIRIPRAGLWQPGVVLLLRAANRGGGRTLAFDTRLRCL